ncbi:sphingolipid delta(4)-desaturase DES1-like [Ischnura elegans]|uniref:sphingolipid delta(4)-desaturase DES1-like n=1 Tax=Ischnura elegans TaxID=197161 RepID=UPI001ED887E2|nr:sphingolipid delta(4)-desaturase DES1-like [Ischnura elegans]
MGAHVSRDDFEWAYTEQPHTNRRKEILAKYPQIQKLYGHDPNLKWVLFGLVSIQFISWFFLWDQSWPVILICGYCFGGVINHSFMCAVHDLSHNLAFGQLRPTANRMLGIFVNLPIGVPFAMSFQRYHREHHRYLGNEKLDPDVPTLLEAKLFCTTLGKLLWVMLLPLFYAFRPVIRDPKRPTLWEITNFVIQITFDIFVIQYFGWKIMVYMILGSLMAMGLHPMGGHFISEHYMFRKGFETYSYYGPLNFITFNVGYHNEHHDFPAVPGSKLPEIKRIASEYYDHLPQHHSWTRVLYDFVMDPDIGPYARIKRKHKGLDS